MVEKFNTLKIKKFCVDVIYFDRAAATLSRAQKLTNLLMLWARIFRRFII